MPTPSPAPKHQQYNIYFTHTQIATYTPHVPSILEFVSQIVLEKLLAMFYCENVLVWMSRNKVSLPF